MEILYITQYTCLSVRSARHSPKPQTTGDHAATVPNLRGSGWLTDSFTKLKSAERDKCA